MSKFKVGDKLRVVRKSGFNDPGSAIRNGFVVDRVSKSYNENCNLYFPTDGKQGAFENQLEYEIIKNWREEL